MNLFNLYEAALENAKSKNIVKIDVKYIKQYVKSVHNGSLSPICVQLIVDTHKEWIENEGEADAQNFQRLLKSQLESYEVTVY